MIERTKDNKFEIKRVIRIDGDPEQLEQLKIIRDRFGYDALIKDEKNLVYLLCNDITEATIISEELIAK